MGKIRLSETVTKNFAKLTLTQNIAIANRCIIAIKKRKVKKMTSEFCFFRKVEEILTDEPNGFYLAFYSLVIIGFFWSGYYIGLILGMFEEED